MFKNFLVSITHNAISLMGTAIASAALVLMGSLFAIQLWGYEGGPYLGILLYLILPMIFVVGLILIPIGAVLYRRKLRRETGGEVALMPVFDLNNQATRRWVMIFVALTMLNIVIVAGNLAMRPDSVISRCSSNHRVSISSIWRWILLSS